ncbi:hypothetical protein V2J09_020314 [Rumex salicifolius]
MDSMGLPRALFRLLVYCSSLLGIVSFSYILGFLALSFSSLSIAPPVTVPSHCKIVSSNVDLRSSKVCELGLLNFKAKHVFYPSERRKFRCHYDYYWASVFKVEYFDHLSGEMVPGFAEAPKEALPHDCRPDFGAALLTRHKFKVNESYNCWYSTGMPNIEIFQDSNFGCHVKGPSGIEMIRRYFILSTRISKFWLASRQLPASVGWGMAAGTTVGFFAPLILIIFSKLLPPLMGWCHKVGSHLMATLVRRLFVTRAFFLLAYFSFVGLVAIQYAKRLGLPVVLVGY